MMSFELIFVRVNFNWSGVVQFHFLFNTVSTGNSVSTCAVTFVLLQHSIGLCNELSICLQKNLMVLIGSLCSCKSDSGLPKADVVTFTALLKCQDTTDSESV